MAEDLSLLNVMAALQGGFSDPSQLAQAEQSDPWLGKLGAAGAIGFGTNPGGEQQWQVDWNAVNKVLPTVGGMTWGTGLQNWHPLGGGGQANPNTASVGMVNGRPSITQANTGQQNVQVGNRSALEYVPGAGWVTPGANIRVTPKTDWMDKFAEIAPMLITSGLGAGFGSLMGLGGIGQALMGAGRQTMSGAPMTAQSFLPQITSLLRGV